MAEKLSSLYKNLLLILFTANTCNALEIKENKKMDELYLRTIYRNMNRTVDPCEDFFGYACGSWTKNYNDNTHYVDMAGYMDYKVGQKLLELLKQHRTAGGIYEKLWQYFYSCVELKSPALNRFLRLVQSDLNFTWPIFRNDWHASWTDESNFNWLIAIAHLRWYGLNGIFIAQHVNVRLLNGSHYLLEILPHQDTQKLIEADVMEIFKNFGMTEGESLQITQQVMDLETRVHNLTLANAANVLEQQHHNQTNKYEESFKELTLTELQALAKNIDWDTYFHITLGRALNDSTELVQTFSLTSSYFEDLQATLQLSTNETIAYYIMLKFMYHLNYQLPHGDNDESGRMDKCITLLRGYMPLAINFLYEDHVYRYERNKTDAAVQKMFHNLKRYFAELIAENHLGLDVYEQNFVLEELNEMQLKIGNIPLPLTHQFVIDYYTTVRMNSSDFYANQLQLLRQQTCLHLKQLEKHAQSVEHGQFFHLEPATASSSSPVKIFRNVILVPYGYLQLPFYESSLDQLYQYSLLGFILAHEIIHGFDLFHIVYDKQSNYNELGAAVAQHFATHLQCLNGEGNTLSENMADVSGLRLAYKTYFDGVNWQDTFDAQKAELFFVNSVQFLCANMDKISTLDLGNVQLGHDMHDTRVRQNWRLFEEFGRVFKCKKDAEMYLESSCRLW